MAFGLSNIPAIFQGYINKRPDKKLDVFVIVYQDDILIYTNNSGQVHVNAIWWVLKKLENHRLFANLKKSWFYKDEVRFFGYIVSTQKVKIENEQIKAMKNWPKSKSMKNI